MVKNIMFNFDGVIVDSFGLIFDLARKYNLNIKTQDYRKLFERNIFFYNLVRTIL